MTTRKSYAERLQEISWSPIPSTFQDAITFSMTLGIDLIWIGPWCVVQHDSVDWREQHPMWPISIKTHTSYWRQRRLKTTSGRLWKAYASYVKPFQTDAGSFTLLFPSIL
jgi:hypothetical protein